MTGMTAGKRETLLQKRTSAYNVVGLSRPCKRKLHKSLISTREPSVSSMHQQRGSEVKDKISVRAFDELMDSLRKTLSALVGSSQISLLSISSSFTL